VLGVVAAIPSPAGL